MNNPSITAQDPGIKLAFQIVSYEKKLVGDHPFRFKEVGRAGGGFFPSFFLETGMNVVVKTKISYILERVFN